VSLCTSILSAMILYSRLSNVFSRSSCLYSRSPTLVWSSSNVLTHAVEPEGWRGRAQACDSGDDDDGSVGHGIVPSRRGRSPSLPLGRQAWAAIVDAHAMLGGERATFASDPGSLDRDHCPHKQD